jgi:hypothetical protein
MTTEHPRPARRRGALALGAGGLLLAGLLSTNSPVAFLSTAHGSSSHADTDVASAAAQRLRMQLVDTMPVPAAVPPEALLGSPEARLIAVYRLIAAHHLDAALQAADALGRSYPNFKLAQLVRADLMSARFGTLAGFGTSERQGGTGARTDDLNVLRDEARLRLQALQERPPQGALPDEFVSLPASTRFAIAVDTSRARLYLFENSGMGLKLVDDVYVSVGKQGVDKLIEGDQKTPLGVYFITDRLDPRSLQERFGAGALPLNYPNAYDKARGRTGSGILLHGVPTSTYSRPPLDSDGCGAMANDDLQRLAARLPQRDTPVVITRQINWVPAGESPQAELRAGFNKALATWQQARLRADRESLQALYETSGPSDGAAEARFRQRVASPPASISDISVLTWHDDKDKMVVTFRELAASAGQRDRVMRQYWGRYGNSWRIVAEGPVR